MRNEQRLIVLLVMLVGSTRAFLHYEFAAASAAPEKLSRPMIARPSPLPPSGGKVLLEDAFAGEDGLITSYEHYAPAPFPLGGTSLPSNPSPMWEGESGWLHRQGNWGFSGRPRDWNNRYFFRIHTRSFAIQDAQISWRYRSARFGEEGFPTEPADAADVWLRFQNQYDLYVFQFDRMNDGMVAKRKIPAAGWSGPPDLVANKGVYYTLPTDHRQPVIGAGRRFVPWTAVQALLPEGERSKPGFPNLAHDRLTEYDFAVTIRNLPGGKVQIQGYRAGVLVYSATDDGRGGIAANGETQGMHVDWGYFEKVPGWTPSWGRPIVRPGACGFRADNIELWISGFSVRSLDPATVAPAHSAG